MTRAKTSVEINEILAERRSPRSFDANAEISKDEVTALLEAARWAPSANNLQPWSYIVGIRGDANYTELLDCLVPFNQSWANRCSVLIAVAGIPTTTEDKPNPTFMFDCGLSVAQLTFEAYGRGLVAHQMAGFDHEKAATMFNGAVPIAIIAIGKQAPAEQLEGILLERELAVRTRKDLSEIVISGL